MTLATADFKDWEEETKVIEEVKTNEAKVEDQIVMQMYSEIMKLGRISNYFLFKKEECRTQYQYWQSTN